jgi:hypothetical protein
VADDEAASFPAGVLLVRLAEQLRPPAGPDLAVAASAAGTGQGGTAGQSGPPVLLGRRSAACGDRCGRRPCDGYELHAAGLLAPGDGQAWLRLWVQTLVLAFLTGRPLPHLPVPLRSGWRALSPRRRECVLATVIDDAVTVRATALRQSYDPRFLMSVVRVVTARMLDAATRGALPLPAGT